jgi:glyoxylase-like metal-dependent hydrolase (beta-lactamase superfamily II)
MKIEAFFDNRTYTLTYVVFDPETRDAVIIDPVLDYEPVGSKVFTESVEQVLDFVNKGELKVHAILETHAHADHLSGSQELKKALPGVEVIIGAKITAVQDLFKGFFDLPADFPTDGRQFDRLLDDGEELTAGTITIKAIATPGHTPACLSYLIDDAVFTGDALFMPDYGTGRCDFPAGDPRDLYNSVHERLYALPDATRVFVGHDYLPDGRDLAYESTIGEEKAKNVQLPADRSEADFVTFRAERDATLAAPKLIYQSVQVNIDAGHLPPAAGNGRRYFRLPINLPPAANKNTAD